MQKKLSQHATLATLRAKAIRCNTKNPLGLCFYPSGGHTYSFYPFYQYSRFIYTLFIFRTKRESNEAFLSLYSILILYLRYSGRRVV